MAWGRGHGRGEERWAWGQGSQGRECWQQVTPTWSGLAPGLDPLGGVAGRISKGLRRPDQPPSLRRRWRGVARTRWEVPQGEPSPATCGHSFDFVGCPRHVGWMIPPALTSADWRTLRSCGGPDPRIPPRFPGWLRWRCADGRCDRCGGRRSSRVKGPASPWLVITLNRRWSGMSLSGGSIHEVPLPVSLSWWSKARRLSQCGVVSEVDKKWYR